jgi:hypothetical protein
MMKHVLKMAAVVGLMVSALAASAEETVVWNGEGTGQNKFWKSGATAVVENGALTIDLNGKNWRGVGLNWEGWNPNGAGIQLTDYKYMLVELKTTGNVYGLRMQLIDKQKKKSGQVDLRRFAPGGKLPAEFATLKIPTSAFLAKAKFDSGVVWEVVTHLWTQDQKAATATLNKIAFSNE